MRISALLGLVVALSACGQPTTAAREPATTALGTARLPASCPNPITTRALDAASAGLLYTSETDAPWSGVWYPGRAQLPTPAQLADLAGRPGRPVELRDPRDFFSRLSTPADRDPASVQQARRYAVLYAVLRARYTALQVYRVIDGPQVHVFVLGLDHCGVSGLETLGVET